MLEKFKKWAIYFTAGYLIIVAAMSIYNFLPESQGKLSPNAFGDFIAGAMSPLAIFWLVMVYVQQREEMRDQVEQTKKIAIQTQKQVEKMDEQFKKQYEPFFVCHEVGFYADDANHYCGFLFAENLGGTAWDLCGELINASDMNAFQFQTAREYTKQNRKSPEQKEAIYVTTHQWVLMKFKFLIEDGDLMMNRHDFYFTYQDLVGRHFSLEGQYWIGSNMKGGESSFQGKAQGVLKEQVFLNPARLASE